MVGFGTIDLSQGKIEKLFYEQVRRMSVNIQTGKRYHSKPVGRLRLRLA